MPKPTVYKIDECGGIDNVNRPSRAANDHFQELLNVDVSDTGSVYRRMGWETSYTGNAHSLGTNGSDIIFVEGTSLKRLESDGTATTLRSDLTSSDRMSYLYLDGRLYYSNGFDSGVYQNRVSRSWGLPIPQTPVVSATVGDLQSGTYGVRLTYMRNDGQEGGASVPVYVDATAGGMTISITASTEPDVDRICVYITTTDGEVFWRQGTLDNAATTWTIRGGILGAGVQLETANMVAPPPCQKIVYHYGRIYMASGSTIWHTEPYRYELVSLDRNFMFFDDTVTLMESVENGLWVGTRDNSMFLAGKDPQDDGGLKIKVRTSNGCVNGAHTTVNGVDIGKEGVAQGKTAIWAGKGGIFAGDSNGQLIDLTGGVFVPPDVDSGWAVENSDGDITRVTFGFKTWVNDGIGDVPVTSTGTGTAA